jgi:hypothetical protein
MLYLILTLIVLFMLYEKRKVTDEIDKSTNFHLSNGMSKDTYTLMHTDGLSNEDLKKFVEMEDQFLECEKSAVSTGVTDIVKATILSNKIKETFPKYNFSYHTIHLKQIAEPNKIVNIKIMDQ